MSPGVLFLWRLLKQAKAIKKFIKYRWLRILMRSVAWFFLALAGLLVLLQLLILLPPVQDRLRSVAVSAIEEQLEAEAEIGYFRLGFPKKFRVGEIHVRSKAADTLVSIGEFSVNVELLPLLKKKIMVRRVALENVRGDIGKLMAQLPASPDTTAATPQPEAVPGEQGNGWTFGIGHLDIVSIDISYRDEVAGFDLELVAGQVRIGLGDLDFDSLIRVSSIAISDTDVSFEILDTPPSDEDTTATPFANIDVGKVALDNVAFALIDSTGGLLLSAWAGGLTASRNFLDITHTTIEVDKVELRDSYCDLVFLPAEKAPVADTTSSGDGMDLGQALWRITGNRVAMKNCRYSMNYEGEPLLEGHFDPLHLDIREASGEITDFILDADTLVATISNLSAREVQGMEIEEFDASLLQDERGFRIEGLKLRTPNTSVDLELETTSSPTDFTGMETKNFTLGMEVRGQNWRDADYFYPFLDSTEILGPGFAEANFSLQANLAGTLQDLHIRRFMFSMLDSTILTLRGQVEEPLNAEGMSSEIILDTVMAAASELHRLLALPDTLNLPSYVIVSGKYKGAGTQHDFTGEISSSVGDISLERVKARTGDDPHYEMKMMASLHDLEDLIDPSLESASFDLEARFEGSELSLAAGEVHVNMDSLRFNAHEYRDVHLDAMLDKGEFSGVLVSGLPEFLFRLEFSGTYQEDILAADLSLDVENLDLNVLNFADTAFTLAAGMDLSLGMGPEERYGLDLSLAKLDLDYRDSLYRMHPVTMTFATAAERTDFTLKSHFYELIFTAGAHVEEMGRVFAGLPGYYFGPSANDSVPFLMPDFSVSGSLEYQEVFAKLFLPGLPEFETLAINGGYSAASDELTLDVFMPYLRSTPVEADSLDIRVDGSSEQLDFAVRCNLTVDDLLTGTPLLEGSFRNSVLKAHLRYLDARQREYINLTALVDTSDGAVHVKVDPELLVFSYNEWEMDPDNELVIGRDSIAVKDFMLRHESESIVIADTAGPPPGIELKFVDFTLGSIEQLLDADTVVRGVANADVLFLDPLGKPAIKGNLTIDGLSVAGFEAGKLSVSSFAIVSDTISVELDLSGEREQIHLAARYLASDTVDPVKADVTIEHLDLVNLEHALAEHLQNPKGSLQGKISISGRADDPHLNGSLRFSDASMGIVFLDASYTLGNETIEIEDNVLNFNNFSITNAQNQSARIIGTINLGDISKAHSDLEIKTDNMEIMNSKQQENDILFGLLKAQANIKARGEVNDIMLTADVTIDPETDVTYIFPDNLALDNNDGIVRYEKFDAEMKKDEDVEKSTSFLSMNSFRRVQSRIEIREGARFNLFFDSGGSNFLDASFDGTINFSQQQDNTEVSGMFKVEEGVLHYGIPMVAVDEYVIEPGSSISLSNDLYNPYLSIVASSNVRASTEGLMKGDPKVMTFKILLYLEGELNDLQLRFDISQETGDALVSSRLSQLTDQERNVNALNLLVRGSFAMSLQGDEVGGTTTVDAQLDKFYTTHLNHLISENVSFVDLKFDVQSFKEYNTSGESVVQRNYYYNVGKSFFNDRARVSYKGSLGVTNDLQSEQVNSQLVQNELELEVKITKDGVLRGVFFRKNQYEGLLEGEVIQTGVGARLRKDFYSIPDIFLGEEKLNRKDEKKTD